MATLTSVALMEICGRSESRWAKIAVVGVERDFA